MLPRLPAGFDTYYEANATTASGASFIVQKKFYTWWGKEAPTAAPTYSFKGKGSCLTSDGKMPPRRAKGDGATYNDPFAGTEADCKVAPAVCPCALVFPQPRPPLPLLAPNPSAARCGAAAARRRRSRTPHVPATQPQGMAAACRRLARLTLLLTALP